MTSRSSRAPPPPPPAANAAQSADLGGDQGLPARPHRAAEDVGRAAAARRAGVLQPRRGRRLRLRASCSRSNREEVAAAVKELQERPHPGQPGLRGDGGRRRRRARARRLRRDHRRRRRRLRPGERRPVRHHDARPARPSSSRATSSRWSRRRSFGTEPKFAGQGRRARPRRRRQGRVRRGAARRRLPASPPRREFVKHAQRARRGREGVGADARGRVHGRRRDDADDVGVLRRLEELALHRRQRGRRRRASSPPRACRTSATSSAASC